MKKINFIVLGLTALSTISVAQEAVEVKNTNDLRRQLMFGLKAGANYSNVYDTKGEQFNADPKLGFAGGAFLTIPIGKFIGVQPEVLFSQKGFEATGSILGSPYSFTRTTDFIDIPLFLALKPTEFLTLLAGPQFSYLLKQRDVFEHSNSSVAQEKEFSNDNIRKNIMGVVGGIDVTLTRMVIAGRVAWDVQTNNGDGSSSTPRYKNVWYQLTFGYRFI